MQDQGKVLSQ